jgi:hypothetical protein
MINIGFTERFLENLKKIGKDKIIQDDLKISFEAVEVHRDHIALLMCDNINSTDYFKENIFSHAEKHYIITSAWIRELLQANSSRFQATVELFIAIELLSIEAELWQ